MILKNEKDLERFKNKNWIYCSNKPTEYPCIAEERVDSHEDAYTIFIYEVEIDHMKKAIMKAKAAIAKAHPHPHQSISAKR